MKVHVDFSIFISSPTESKAYGCVHGTIELPAIPSSGDDVLFVDSPKNKLFPKVEGATWSLAVSSVMFPVGKEKTVHLLLQDVVVKTKPDAEALVDYFVDGFDLDSDCFLDDDIDS